MSGEEQNLQVQCRHTVREQPERSVKYTFWLFCSIVVCVFGNSFLYGYNIGVVNSPASIIKLFYAKVNLAKDGKVTQFKDDSLYYVRSEIPRDSATVGKVNLDSTDNSYNTNYNTTVLTNNEVRVVSPDEDLMDWWWSVTVAIFVLFGMVGAFVSGKIADGYGRKRGMVYVSFFMILAAVLGGIANLRPIMSPVWLIFSRAFAGLNCGIINSLAPLYLAEISPKKIRGAVGTVHQLFITLGLLWSMVMGLPVIAALNKLRGYAEDDRLLDSEIEEMKLEALKASTERKFSLKQLLTIHELRKPLIIAVVLHVAQQWSGINAVMSYSSFIFRQASIPPDTIPYVIVGQGAVNVIATIIAIPLLEKAGRRPLLLYPMIIMAGSFTAFVFCLSILKGKDENEMPSNGLAIACIVLMLAYIVGFAIGLGPLPYVVVPEIFRQESRAAATGFSMAINWICNLSLMLLFIFIQKNMQEYAYVIFAIVIVSSGVFFFVFLPETKNRTFDDIADSVAYWRPKRPNMVEEIGEEMQSLNIGNTENPSDGS